VVSQQSTQMEERGNKAYKAAARYTNMQAGGSMLAQLTARMQLMGVAAELVADNGNEPRPPRLLQGPTASSRIRTSLPLGELPPADNERAHAARTPSTASSATVSLLGSNPALAWLNWTVEKWLDAQHGPGAWAIKGGHVGVLSLLHLPRPDGICDIVRSQPEAAVAGGTSGGREWMPADVEVRTVDDAGNPTAHLCRVYLLFRVQHCRRGQEGSWQQTDMALVRYFTDAPRLEADKAASSSQQRRPPIPCRQLAWETRARWPNTARRGNLPVYGAIDVQSIRRRTAVAPDFAGEAAAPQGAAEARMRFFHWTLAETVAPQYEHVWQAAQDGRLDVGEGQG
jgi:hypothetical protein